MQLTVSLLSDKASNSMSKMTDTVKDFSEKTRAEYGEVTERLNPKSRDYIEAHERTFASAMAQIFSLEGRDNTTLLQICSKTKLLQARGQERYSHSFMKGQTSHKKRTLVF